MLKSINLGAILFFLIFTISCKNDPIVEDVSVTIEDEFKILLWESLDENSHTFNLNIETIQSESCENSLIDIVPFTMGSNISFIINDIPPPDCQLPNFVANANIEVGSLNFQSYHVNISLKDVIQNEGTLTVEDDFYELEMEELNGIIVPEKRLYKIPQNTIWGYIASDNSNADSVADGFISELDNVVENQDYSDGYYGYFSAENNKLTILNQDILQSSIRTFGFSYVGDNLDLMVILSTYRSQNSGVDFKVFTSKGEEL